MLYLYNLVYKYLEKESFMYTPGKNRIISLDIMRGFAILGIFLVNMLSFHSPILYLDPFTWWNNPGDEAVYRGIDVLAQGSFYPLFSFLFGYGLVLMYESNTKKGVSFYPIAVRRLLMLLAIGIVHAVFIWHGDILINYALLGMLLLLFLKLSGKSMLIVGGLIWFIPNLLLSLLFIVAALFAPGEEISVYDAALAEQSVEIYQQGSYFEILKQRVEDWYAVNNLLNSIFMLFSIFPFFLIGGGMAKLKWLEKVRELKKPFMIGFTLFLIIGLTLKLSPYIISQNIAWEYVQDAFGGPILALGYVFGIALWVGKSPTNKFLKVLAPVGKTSMSNYLLQSIISTLFFYSYGFGFYDRISVLTGTVLVLVIYGLQVLLSSYWLKSHPFGPVEWLWRSVTYKKKQQWRYR